MFTNIVIICWGFFLHIEIVKVIISFWEKLEVNKKFKCVEIRAPFIKSNNSFNYELRISPTFFFLLEIVGKRLVLCLIAAISNK
jgi:hypothetical protein